MIRLIEIDSGGAIRLGTRDIEKPLSGRDEALQRLLLALYNRPGTNIEEPAWGAGVKEHLGQRIKLDGRARVAELVDMINASLSLTERSGDPWGIEGVDLIDTERLTRGRKINLLIRWFNNPDEEVSMEVS